MEDIKQTVAVKTIIIIFMVGCFLHPPYGFFQVMKIVLVWVFGHLAFKEWENERYFTSFLSGIGVILFNPLFPLVFKKSDWHVIDSAILIITVAWIVSDIWIYKKRGYL